MKTITRNIGTQEISSNRAAAEAGDEYSTVSKEFVKEFKTRKDTVKVVLRGYNSWNNRIQQTFYCHPK